MKQTKFIRVKKITQKAYNELVARGYIIAFVGSV